MFKTFLYQHLVFGKALVLCLLGVATSTANDRVLERIQVTHIASTESFVAVDRFKEGKPIGLRRLALLGGNFAQHFRASVESYVPSAPVVVSELRFTMSDTSIIQTLGGEDCAITHLAHIHAIMEADVAGANHTNWQSNIAFLRSPIDHRLWAIHWSVNEAGEWLLGAVNVPHAALDWAAGTRVFSTLRTTPVSPPEASVSK